MRHDSDAILIAETQDELARLERLAEYGRNHPFAGYCGEDDALQDKIDDCRDFLRREGVTA